MASKHEGPLVISVEPPPLDTLPRAQTIPFAQRIPGGESISGPSFIRRQKEMAAPCFPVSALAWFLLRELCDWYDSNFTQDGDSSARNAVSVRLMLLLVPFLAFVDVVLNFLICVSVLPILVLKCCYPFKTKLIDVRKKGSPNSCCCLHEACDPCLRVLTSAGLFVCSPLVLCGICMPTWVANRVVYWADGHTSGYAYCDRSCCCCSSQYPFGLFFRNRSVGDVMA